MLIEPGTYEAPTLHSRPRSSGWFKVVSLGVVLRKKRFVVVATCVGLAIALGMACPLQLQAQGNPPKFEVDPSWPKPLPDHWITGSIGGVCVDSNDNVFILNRGNLSDHELDAARPAPPIIEFDSQGNVVRSFGDPNTIPTIAKTKTLDFHGCAVDAENNVAVVVKSIVREYSNDGSKIPLQIGQKDVYDSSDGTTKGTPLNASHTLLFSAGSVAFDRSNGDIYIADGEADRQNHRVVVYDHNGHFLRQWGLHRDDNETGKAFTPVLHCINLSNDGLVYVCDRQAGRVQVFDKMGNFKKNIKIPFEQRSPDIPHGPGGEGGLQGTALGVAFSNDKEQRFMYVVNRDDEQIEILDRTSGKILSTFGRAGHNIGEFTIAHFIAVDSKGNIYVTELTGGDRVQRFKMIGHQ